MLVGIISRPITCQIPPGTPELWPLNCPKTELAVSALQVEYPAPKNVVTTIEFTTNMTAVFWVSLALLLYLVFLSNHIIQTGRVINLKLHRTVDLLSTKLGADGSYMYGSLLVPFCLRNSES